MSSYIIEFQVIWADIDANRHMRHTAYNDYAAQVRLQYFADHGFSVSKLETEKTGPILFREETIFAKEVGMNEKIKVDLKLSAMRRDGSRWKITHTIYKSSGDIACIINVEGAWLDLEKRKLKIPPEEIMQMVNDMPKTDDFVFLPDKVS